METALGGSALRAPTIGPGPAAGRVVAPPIPFVEVRGPKVEHWGLCVSCDRWFYCGTTLEQTRDCRCPACDQAPVAIRESWE